MPWKTHIGQPARLRFIAETWMKTIDQVIRVEQGHWREVGFRSEGSFPHSSSTGANSPLSSHGLRGAVVKEPYLRRT